MIIKQIDLWGNETEVKDKVKPGEEYKIELQLEKTFNHFGKITQLEKLDEEIEEMEFASKDYSWNDTKENYNHLLEECIDQLIVILGIGVGLYDIRLSDAYNLALEKINRTELIINMSDKEKDLVSEYERIRRELK